MRPDGVLVLVSPYRFAVGYLPLVLPSSVSKLVWLQPDVLILSDIRRLYETHALMPRLGFFEDVPSKVPYEMDELIGSLAPMPLLLYTPRHFRALRSVPPLSPLFGGARSPSPSRRSRIWTRVRRKQSGA